MARRASGGGGADGTCSVALDAWEGFFISTLGNSESPDSSVLFGFLVPGLCGSSLRRRRFLLLLHGINLGQSFRFGQPILFWAGTSGGGRGSFALSLVLGSHRVELVSCETVWVKL